MEYKKLLKSETSFENLTENNHTNNMGVKIRNKRVFKFGAISSVDFYNSISHPSIPTNNNINITNNNTNTTTAANTSCISGGDYYYYDSSSGGKRIKRDPRSILFSTQYKEDENNTNNNDSNKKPKIKLVDAIKFIINDHPKKSANVRYIYEQVEILYKSFLEKNRQYKGQIRHILSTSAYFEKDEVMTNDKKKGFHWKCANNLSNLNNNSNLNNSNSNNLSNNLNNSSNSSNKL